MKRFLQIFLFFISLSSFSQILDPVKWEFGSTNISGDEYELIFVAKIDTHWSLYSQFVDEGGPLPTIFLFEPSADYELIGSVVESKTNKVTQRDPVFDMIVSKYYDKAVFKQRIRVNSSAFGVKGNIDFMTCDDTKCTYKPDNPFVFEFNLESGFSIVGGATMSDLDISENSNSVLYGIAENELQKLPANCTVQTTSLSQDINSSRNTLWQIFWLGFLGGLLALLTPCVFPMIPLTVSFFTKNGVSAKNNNGVSKAILYGFFIVLVYLALSTPFHLLDSVNPDVLNEISTNVWLNVFFFVIFIFFAFSFFGYYELTLPSKWTSSTTKGEGIGGVLGIFFMALTLSIVSFSCTGPILGSLLAGSLTAEGGAWQLTAGMGGFGLALGLPFALFAMFPNLLRALPKSGGWLNTTKVVLGFFELALAFKFLSNADLVKHWGLLKIEVFLGIWILIFASLAIYIFGKLKFPHDSPIKKLSFFRVSSGVLVLAFVIYLISGFRFSKDTQTFTSLTLLSGLAPPVGYSFVYPNDCPNNFECFKDFKEGVAYAQKVNKPILIDFTGYACVNCRKMEEHIWPKSSIKSFFQDDYVLISLYVDDKKELPDNQKLVVERQGGGARVLENYGNKWAHFQTQFFQSNSQPYYALLSPDGKTVLTPPVGYTPSEENYKIFLDCGLEAFSNLNLSESK